MKASTPLLVAAVLVVVGGATFWLAASNGEANVRQVQQVLDAPAAHTGGTYTLIGVPEPNLVPLTGPNGTFLAPNPDRLEAVRTTTSWSLGTLSYFSTTTVNVTSDAGGLLWTVRNETRRLPSDAAPAFPPSTATFRLGATGQAFPIQGFGTGGAPGPAIWAYYDRAPENPLQPKPSQFGGHLLATLPDGTPLPPGVLVWKVETYTAGCSSKFLPPEAQAKYNVTA